MGMPGSGKSTLGRAVASLLGFDFYDLDAELVKEEGSDIPTIFMEKGEGYFRNLETRVLQKLLGLPGGMVLSTGGGAPCFNDNINLINASAVSVYLEVSLDELLSRLTKDEISKRPMFKGLDTAEITLKLQDLLTGREEFYRQAKIMLSGDDISTEHLSSEMMSYFRN